MDFLPDSYSLALAVIAVMAVCAWLASLVTDDVSFVDSLWSLFFLAASLVFALAAAPLAPAAVLLLSLVVAWSLRLSLHITVRNWGEPEDSRYQQIRENNQPGFRFKSLYIVFGLQGLLAWIICVPLLFGIRGAGSVGGLELVAAGLWLVGFVFEAGGDWQLMRFQQRDTDKAVLDTGLWRYTRHPNYFGEACMWWAYWLFAVAAGAWWTVYAPLLMTFLLLKVSGVAMLEKTIGERRPEYAAYIERTSAFIPMPPKTAADNGA